MEEQRQNIQIRERAGLEEARLNQDFIDFVTKWSTPLLVVIALVVGGNYLYQQYTKRENEKLTRGFEQLAAAAAVANPSPDSLRQVAADFEGVASVSVLAHLKAGDAYMRSIMRGVKPGADVNQDGTIANVSDELTDEDRAGFLSSAFEQYKLAAEQVKGKPGKETLYVGALFGMAAVAESRGQEAEAKALYEQIKSAAAGTSDLQDFAKIAENRIADLPKVLAVGKLPPKATLPPATREEAKPALPANLPTATPGALDIGPPSSSPVGPVTPPAEPASPAPATPK
ncbi:MAG: hypothetical protein U0573_14470 [Phycisphaerales bacterium]|nr:hypothetical protein [Planctomycetota bacterium]